jgi:hypothetical protein
MQKSFLRELSRTPATRKQEGAPIPAISLDSEQWLNGLVARMFQLMHNFEADNFDASRYRNEAPNAFFYDRHAGYFSFLLKHIEEFHHTRTLFADETSRVLYDALAIPLLGHLRPSSFNTTANRAHLATPELACGNRGYPRVRSALDLRSTGAGTFQVKGGRRTHVDVPV